MDDQRTQAREEAVELPIDAPSYWVIPAPEPTPPHRRIGWLAVGVGIAALLLTAAGQAFGGETPDPNDPGVADVLFVISPMLAAGAALITGVLLLVVIRLRLVDLSQRRTVRATLVGLFGGPVVYLVVLIGSASALDAANDGRLIQIMIFLPPVVLGAGLTLIAALISHMVRVPR